MNNSIQFLKKSIAVFAMTFLMSSAALAQAVLPTSWNFDSDPPAGWSESLGTSGNFRYAAGQAGQACRLDNDGEFVQVQFAEEPGVISYYVKGQNSGGAWQGIFDLQESVTGAEGTYTTLRTWSNTDMPTASYTLFSDTPNPDSRYLRFIYTDKVSGHNLALDEVSLAAPVAGGAQEINVQFDGNNIPTGFNAVVGNASSSPFTIQNQGSVSTLNIASIELSGTDAAQFSLTDIPASVEPNGSAVFNLLFDGQGSGSKYVTITIENDDTSEGTYVINVEAIAGSLATEPAEQPTALTFSGVNAWDFNVGFTAATGAEKYIMLRRKGAAVNDMPMDGTTYLKGQWIGDAQVVYIGEAAVTNARNVEASTTYHFAVFAFNGPVGFENYLTTSPLAGSTTTSGPAIGSTYSGVDNTSAQVVSQINAAMNPANYFQVFYSNYISTLINEFYVKDTVIEGVALNAVECQYSGYNHTYPSGFQFWSDGGPGELSREHIFPQSWMPTFFDSGFDDSQEVSDLHNLFPVLQEECNAVRSNYPYGEVVSGITNSYLDTKLGNNALGQKVYEPRDQIKGDAARAMMYQSLKNNTSTNDFSFPEQISLTIQYRQNEYLIKSWHFNDLPDNYEIARNEYIKTKQNNRNAFIDSIAFPCYVRFSNLTKWAPQFTQSNGVLTSIDPGISYQWYKDGEEIEGATQQTYTATANGQYSLEVQQFVQCPAFTSTAVSVIVDNISEANMKTLDFATYPNPADNEFNVVMDLPRSSKIEIRIIDAQGRVVNTISKNGTQGRNVFNINEGLSSGIYFVEVSAIESIGRQRIVIK